MNFMRFPEIRKKELFIQLSRMWPQLLESHIKILDPRK